MPEERGTVCRPIEIKKYMNVLCTTINQLWGCVMVERSKAPYFPSRTSKVAGSSPAAASMAVNSSEVELRHIEVVNGWYTVRVLLHVT